MTRTRSLPLAALAILVAALAGGCRPAPPPETSPVPGPAANAMPPSPEQTATFPLSLQSSKTGEFVTFDGPPQRIVSLSPPITETLFALGLGSRVVGDTRFCTYPPEAKDVEHIGGLADPSAEKIISLNPDVVFATVGNPMPVIEALRKAGIKVFNVDPKSYDDVITMVRTLGRICGVDAAATKVIKQLEDARTTVRQRIADARLSRQPKVLFVVWLDPLYVAGPGTFMADMLQICGAKNAAGDTPNPWKQFSQEMAVAADPEIMLVSTDHKPGSQNGAKLLNSLRTNEAWRGVKAVKEGRVVLVTSDLVARFGPRVAQGLMEVAAGIHPELFSEVPKQAK
jgi:iron complex transport system substrate-binding protein